jgi:polar amino acid transport system substrate-binding protein
MVVRLSRRLACLMLPCLLLLAAPRHQAMAEGIFAQIKQRGTIVVATEALYNPFEFVQDGKIVGYDEDLLHAIVAAWGVKLEQLDVPFSGILVGLDQRKYDFICTAMILNEARVTKYAFTQPVAAAPVALMKRKGDPKVKSVDDLTGVNIGSGVPPSGPTAILVGYNDSLKAQNKAAAKIVYFQSAPDYLLGLANKQVDAICDTTLPLGKMMQDHPGKFEIVGPISKPFYYGWAARADDLDLRQAVNDQLETLRKSGEMAKLQQKWFGFTMDVPDSGYMPPGAK